MWAARLTVMMTSVVMLVTSRAERGAPQCEVTATHGPIQQETGTYANNSGLGLHLWFKADTAAEVTLVITHGQEHSEETFDIHGDKIGSWHKLVVQYNTQFGLEWAALETRKYVDKNKYMKNWKVALKSNAIVIWSTCDIRGISSQPDPTQRSQTSPAPCRGDEQTNPQPSSSSSSHDSNPRQKECGGNQDSSLLYAVYGMAILCALLLLLSLALCVRIFSVMRIKASVEGLTTATYSAPRKPIDDDAIYEEVNDNIIMRSTPLPAQDQKQHTSERPQSEHNSENSLYGAMSQ